MSRALDREKKSEAIGFCLSALLWSVVSACALRPLARAGWPWAVDTLSVVVLVLVAAKVFDAFATAEARWRAFWSTWFLLSGTAGTALLLQRQVALASYSAIIGGITLIFMLMQLFLERGAAR